MTEQHKTIAQPKSPERLYVGRSDLLDARVIFHPASFCGCRWKIAAPWAEAEVQAETIDDLHQPMHQS
jgi:hypothetical protein